MTISNILSQHARASVRCEQLIQDMRLIVGDGPVIVETVIDELLSKPAQPEVLS